MPSVLNKMDNNLEDQVITMQTSQDNLMSEITEMKSDVKKIHYDMNNIRKMLTQMMNYKK